MEDCRILKSDKYYNYIFQDSMGLWDSVQDSTWDSQMIPIIFLDYYFPDKLFSWDGIPLGSHGIRTGVT